MTWGLLLFLGVDLLLIVLAIPLARRRIKPNGLYGLRVPATFADEWVWYEANARSGRDLIAFAIGHLLIAVALYFVTGIAEAAYLLVNAAALGIGAVASALLGWRRANWLLEQRQLGNQHR